MTGPDAITVRLLRSALDHLARDEVVEADADITAALSRLEGAPVGPVAVAHPSLGAMLRRGQRFELIQGGAS